MEDLAYKKFCYYLGSIGIKVVDDFTKKEEKVDYESALRHIKSLVNLHKKLMSQPDKNTFRLPNNIGREVENLKVDLKKNRRYLTELKSKGEKDAFNDFLIEEGFNSLKRAERCIEHIYSFNYIGLIYRSTKRDEICIGNSSSDNLRQSIKGIEIKDFKDFSYNLIEMDMVYYLSKLKRKGIILPWESLIKEFCNLHNFGEDSEGYIKALVSYPYELMKCLNRYKEGKKAWSLKEYKEKMLKAIGKDGESLI